MLALGCDTHDHPGLTHPLTEGAFLREFWKFYYYSDLPARGMEVVLDGEMEETHQRNARRYGQVDPVRRYFQFAPQVLWLPKKQRTGVIAHEIGHALYEDGDHSERDADKIAQDVLGIKITYDRRWPGKGLQSGTKI